MNVILFLQIFISHRLSFMFWKGININIETVSDIYKWLEEKKKESNIEINKYFNKYIQTFKIIDATKENIRSVISFLEKKKSNLVLLKI